ncbi:Clp protease ClpP [Bacillus hominis]|uniref:SDH family Clp fold serine proteinase n=1 Tax=Bacillus hominis TaxID=2817478 RepID=UPI0025A0CFC9|nr:Clp protease ClpP [Bacillus hominis]MDM5434403.1 Clp protease ClpP [Bacillus hominis]
MGMFTEFLERGFSFEQINSERKKYLQKISELRGGRDIITFAADFNKGNAPISIVYDDLLSINDQLANLNGNQLDIILETPGGSGEVAEDIVKLLREKYDHISVIVPGWAKSAGTLIAMSCDEILMEPASALGPIDAQISREGQVFSAEALLKGMDEIKREVQATNYLNPAYIPILQGISPGELQGAQNALDFAKVLVREWLVQYKFKDWNRHSTTGEPVSLDEKNQRADEVASCLCDHSKWLTHGRSIKIKDLEDMKLVINDYSQNEQLAEAIRSYYTLLRMTLATNIYKVYETVDSQIYKSVNSGDSEEMQLPSQPPHQVHFNFGCDNCQNNFVIQANFEVNVPIEEGAIEFPKDNLFVCPSCRLETRMEAVRQQIESQIGKPIV